MEFRKYEHLWGQNAMARSKLPALLIETADNYGASGVLSTAVGLARGLFNFSYKRYSAGHSQFVMARPAFAGGRHRPGHLARRTSRG
jgi:hypothetical protein